MNRTYRRPMFRKGGSADSNGTGITSGLAPRQGYKDPGTVQQDDLSKVDIRNMNMQQLKDLSERMAYKAPPMQSDNSLNNFLINFGLDIASRPSAGPGFGGLLTTAAQSAKDPFKNYLTNKQAYNKSSNDRAINKYNSESDMFKTLIGAQGDILGSDGGSKSYESTQKALKVKELLPRFLELKGRRKEGAELNQEEVLELRQLQEDYNAYRKSDPGEELLMEIFVKGQGDRYFIKKMTELFTDDLKKGANRKYTGQKVTDDSQIKRDAIQAIKVELEELTYAEGGRAGYANGKLVEEQVTETVAPGPMGEQNMNTDNPISYDQLRARLPAEITDDIVELISNSAEALEDFAMISEQSQVDQFNRKYSVNLVLPAEA